MDSPIPGLQRMMLGRNGDKMARATSRVNYSPHSNFKNHIHDGEEILVLDGIFSAEYEDYCDAYYLRDPRVKH